MTTKRPKKTSPPEIIIESTDNVFAEFGIANPVQELMKVRLTLAIYRIVRERGLTQAQAANALGIKRPHMSLLMNDRTGSFSVGRLMEFLAALGQDIEIIIRPSRSKRGDVSIMVT